jgi:hypothetical protein
LSLPVYPRGDVNFGTPLLSGRFGDKRDFEMFRLQQRPCGRGNVSQHLHVGLGLFAYRAFYGPARISPSAPSISSVKWPGMQGEVKRAWHEKDIVLGEREQINSQVAGN